MRLIELNPRFVVYRREGRTTYHDHVETISEADGILFLCPRCFLKNGGPVGTHSVICWSPKVPASARPGPGRWNLTGTGFDDLSLVAGSSSVLLTSGCRWHGFVTNGEVTDVG